MSLYIATVCAWPSFGVAVMLRYENGRDKRTRSVGEIGLRNVALTLTVKLYEALEIARMPVAIRELRPHQCIRCCGV